MNQYPDPKSLFLMTQKLRGKISVQFSRWKFYFFSISIVIHLFFSVHKGQATEEASSSQRKHPARQSVKVLNFLRVIFSVLSPKEG
jgi:hypothetical protein